LVATVIGETRQRLRQLSACIGAPGPLDFAVRDHIARLVMCRVHRIPRSTSVTTAKRPSCKHGTRQEKPTNHADAKPLFFARGLDYPNQLEVIGEIRFLARGILVRSDSMGSDNESRFARRAGTRLNVAMAVFAPCHRFDPVANDLIGHDADKQKSTAGRAREVLPNCHPESTMRSARVPCFENGLLFIGCQTGNRSARGARPKQRVAGGLRKCSHGQA
jgi:hypothetical protein